MAKGSYFVFRRKEMSDPITNEDLHALVDGQLDAARRIEVEEYLARNPGMAAQVMMDMHARDLLLHTCGAPQSGTSPAILEAAGRLERGFYWQRARPLARRIAASLLLVCTGWFAHNFVSNFRSEESREVLVEEAHQSYETVQLRAHVVSQPHSAIYDPAEISAATGITLPPLPGDWVVADAEIFPAKNGESVELLIDTKELRHVSFFAARPARPLDPIPVTSVRWPYATTVYWLQEAHFYALTGSASEADLKLMASKLQAGR